jgi:RNA recognition motif. (a.k.a. RRM, RBD, or RNP domain)
MDATPPITPSSYSQNTPALTVSIGGLSYAYSFTEEDVKKVFSRYGKLSQVELLPPFNQVAVVTFQTHTDAAEALRDLDGKVLTGVHGKLSVEWKSKPNSERELELSFLSSPEHSHVSPQGDAVRKYTCRFEIGIDNDKEFQVARRLIGVKGSNMKRINKETEAKLRLRGKGSGYLEGSAKVESPEPLHLCISCVSATGYNAAMDMVKSLLEEIYADYRKFCKQKGIEFPEDLAVINVREFPLTLYQDQSPTNAP